MINMPQQADDAGAQVQVRQIAPTLFVGLGGTGGEVVARIKRKMELYFASNPDQQHLASMIEYMVVDTARFGLLSQTARAVLREDDDFVYIGGVRGEQINQQASRDPDLRVWIDPQFEAPVGLIDSGANAIRMLSRACLLLSARAPQGITARIQTKLNRIASLARNIPDPTCEIYLVAGSGGGTGSGILWDTTFLLWEQAVNLFPNVRIFAFLLLPFKQAEHIQRQNPYIATRVLANAYALFEELELLLQRPSEINNHFMLAHSRRQNEQPPVMGWFPFEQCYLFDHRLEGVGVFEYLDDLYTYMAKSVYHLFLTPYNAQMQAGLANASVILRTGQDSLHRRRTAYSALGFSSIEYPRELILAYLQARYAHEMLAKGFLWQEDSMAAIAFNHAAGPPHDWANKLGRADAKNLEQNLSGEAQRRIDSSRPRLDQFLERDRRGQPRAGHYDYNQLTRLHQVVSQTYQAIEAIKQRLEAIFNASAPTAYDRVRTEIENLIANSPYGLRFAHEVLAQVDNLITNDLIAVRQTIRELEQQVEQLRLRLDADAKNPGSLKQIEEAIARRDNRTLKQHFGTFINLLSDRLDKEVRLFVARLKERFLVAVAGEPVGGTVAARTREGVVSGYQIAQSILDDARHLLNNLIVQIEGLCQEMGDAMRLRKYYVTSGRELTTTYIPDISSPDQLAASEEVERIFRTVLPGDDAVLQEMQALMAQWQNDPHAVPKLSSLDQPEQVRQRMEQILLEQAHRHFDARVQKSIWQEVQQMSNQARQELLSQLVAKATPACPLDTARLTPTDQGKITYMWAACSENPGELLNSLPQRFQQGVAQVQIPKEQIAVLQSAHSFPFHAIRHLSELQTAYKQILSTPSSYLHLDFRWNREGVAVVAGLNQFSSLVDNDTLRLFVLGLFFDRLLHNRLDIEPVVQQPLCDLYRSMFHHDPRALDNAPLRGLVFYSDSEGAYQALQLEPVHQQQDIRYRVARPISLGATDLSRALEELNRQRGLVIIGVEFIRGFLARIRTVPAGRGETRQWLFMALDAMQKLIQQRYEDQNIDQQTRQLLNSFHACIADFIDEHGLRPTAPPVL